MNKKMKHYLVVLPLSCMMVNSLNAQTIDFDEIPGTPFHGVNNSSIDFADVDGDGDYDVLIGGRNASNSRVSELYINNGPGNFTEVLGTPFEGASSGSIAFEDVDGDGDQDLLITGFNNSVTSIAKLYSNDGSGNFTLVTGTPFDGVRFSSIAFEDIDNDNDQDVLITGYDNSSDRTATLYTNDGSGNFTEVLGTPFEGVKYSSIAFADVDGDNDQDVLITGEIHMSQKSAKLYTNDGSGNFTEVLGTPFDGVSEGAVAFADVDGDNDLDVLITGENASTQNIAKLYTNDGSGIFSELTGTSLSGVTLSSIAFEDVDGDGDEDVLITGKRNAFQTVSNLYQNDGAGNFTIVSGLPFNSVKEGGVKFGDLDGDTDPDLILAGNGIAKLYLNNWVPNSIPNNPSEETIPLYPNPTTNQVSLELAESKEKVQVAITNIDGQLVMTKDFSHVNTININVSDLASGLYFVQLNTGDDINSYKFIKE